MARSHNSVLKLNVAGEVGNEIDHVIMASLEIQFVDAPPKEFDCPICLETLKNPFTIECCHHHFCNTCIDNAKQRKNECPLCKARPIKGVLDDQFKQVINEASVYCSQRSHGCKWTGRFDALNNHLSLGQQNGQCQHVMLNCSNIKCKASMPRHQIMEHVKNCEYRPFVCLHCGHKGAYTEVVTIHYKCCSRYPVVCPNNCSANKTFKRGDLPKHLDTCPNAMVSCPFANVGCKTKMKRCNVKKHNDSNVSQHSLMVNSSITDLKKESMSQKQNLESKFLALESQHSVMVNSAMNDLKKENKLQKQTVELKVSALESKCGQLEKDFFSSLYMYEQNEAKKDQFVASLVEKHAILESNLSLLCTDHARMKDDLVTTCAELKTSLSVRCSVLEDQFYKLKNHLTSSIREVAVREREIKNLYDKSLHKTNVLKKQIRKQFKHTKDNFYDPGDEDLYTCTDDDSSELAVNAVDKENAELRKSLKLLEAKYASLEEKLNNLEAYSSVSETIMKQLQQLEAKVAVLQRPPTEGMKQYEDVDCWVRGYRLMAETMKKHNWRLYLKTMAETATQFPDPVSPVIIKVEGYERAKALRMTLVTAPFYTSGSGKYKLQLIVHVNGYVAIDSATATPVTFMSVHTCLLKGEYDDLLSWPFIGNIMVSLLNQIENNQHHQRAVWLPHDRPTMEYAGRVPPTQHSSCPWGQHTFISQMELESASPTRQYIMNDSLYFEVQATAALPYNCTIN